MRSESRAVRFARILALFSIVACWVSACSESRFNADVQAELLEMGRIDQEVRKQAFAFFRDLPESAEEFKAAVDEQERVDALNFRRLEEIVAEYGWPGRRLVGEEASGAALIVLQHAGLEQQKKYLPLLRAGAAEDDIASLHLARLEDDIRAGEGESQIYGTRVVSDSDGQPILYPIEDPENLDARRKAAGLPPIDEQLQQMEAEIGMRISRGNLARE